MKKLIPLAAVLALAAAVTPAAPFDWEKAVSLYKQGQFRAAIAEFQQVTAEFPDHADSWKFIGLAYYQLKEYEPAVAPLEKALALKQKTEGRADPDCMLALARAEIALQRYDRALAYLEPLTKQQPGAAANFYMLGVAYANLNRAAEATAAFNAAARLDPKDPDAWYYLGIQQFRQGRLDEAITALRSGVAAAPKHAEMAGLLVEALLRRAAGESQEAKARPLQDEAVRVATALKAVRDDGASAELLGRAYLAARKYANAEPALARAVQTSKEPSAALYFNLGFAQAQNKSWARAAEALEQADKLSPGDANTLAYLGYVYENLRRYPQALAAYTRAYEAGGQSNGEVKASIERITPFAKPQ